MASSAPASLNHVLLFSEGDLVANRQGILSDAQYTTLQTRKTRLMWIGVGVFIGLAFVATLFLFFGSKPDNSGILTIIGIGLTICNALVVGILFRQWLKLNADTSTKKVVIIAGQLERVIKPINRRVIHYLIRVNGIETVTPKEVFIAFTHDEPYTLYRTPYTGILLSAERGVA
ncbi:MAG: hypothetical protein SFZ02_15115 [bacterium]|nr:hypothetical protein [bacterium]